MFPKAKIEDKAMRGPTQGHLTAVAPAADPEVQRTRQAREDGQGRLAAATRALAVAEAALTDAEAAAGAHWLATDAVPDALVVAQQRVADAKSMLRVAAAAAAQAEAAATAAWTAARAADRAATTDQARGLMAELDGHLCEAQRLHRALERVRLTFVRTLGEAVAWPAPMPLFTRRALEPIQLPEWRRQMQRAGVLDVDVTRDEMVRQRMTSTGGWA